MSDKKHLHLIQKLFAHPIARNIEWSELIPALSSVGNIDIEPNGQYAFSRNGHTIIIKPTDSKTLGTDDILKLRQFLHFTEYSSVEDVNLQGVAIIAIDHHNATITHNPHTKHEKVKEVHANLTKNRILHKRKQTPPFNDSNPTDSPGYYEEVMSSITEDDKVIILTHGTGSSSAGERLFQIIKEKEQHLVTNIIAIEKCDLEAMTSAEVIALGIKLFKKNSND